MQPSQAEIERPLDKKPKDQDELHATMSAALTFLKEPPKPPVDDATYAAVVKALLSYVSRYAAAKDPFADLVMDFLNVANAQTRKKSLETALSYVNEFDISITTALNLILKNACSPFGDKHIVKVWQGHSALGLVHPYLIPFETYYKGPVLEPIHGTERNGWVLLLTGESGAGKTCLAHQLAERFLFVNEKCVGAGVYLRSGGGHFVVPDELLNRVSATDAAANDAHTAEVAVHLAKVVASLLTARDGKALPKDESVQRVAVVIDDSNSIMTFIRGLIAEPSTFVAALHTQLAGTAAALGGTDLTGFRVAIIVAGTGSGVASCDDATSQLISSHPDHFREVQLPFGDSNTKLRAAILERTKLPEHVISFLPGRPETEPLTTNPRMLWDLIPVAAYFAQKFHEAPDYVSVTAEAAVGVAHTISAAAASEYFKSNALSCAHPSVQSFYFAIACAFVIFKNKLFNVPGPALDALSRYGYFVDTAVAGRAPPPVHERYTMSPAIRRMISLVSGYKLDRLSLLGGAAPERAAADFFSLLVRVVSHFPSNKEYAYRINRLAVPGAAASAADFDGVSVFQLLKVMQPSFKSSDDDMLRNIPLIRSTGSAGDDHIVYSGWPIQCRESVREFFGHEDNVARLKSPGDALIVINGRDASYADVIVVWKDVATLLIQANLGHRSNFCVLTELTRQGMFASRVDGTDERRPARKNRDALLALCELFPKNQVIPIFALPDRQAAAEVCGEKFHAHVPTRASGTDGPGSTARGFKGFFVTPIVVDQNDIYPVVGPNAAASNDANSAATPA